MGLSVNAGWAVLGNLVYVAGRILVVAVLTHFYPSDSVGRILYALAIVTPLSFLVNMEVRSVFVTDRRGGIELGHCLAARLVSNVIYLVILLGFCAILWDTLGWQISVIVILAGMVRIAENLSDVYLGVFQKREQMNRWAVSQSCKTLGVLLWVVAMPLWTDNIAWMLAGWLGVTVFVMLFYDRSRAGRLMNIELRWDKGVVIYLVRRALPLGIFVALAMANQEAGKYFIKHIIGYSSVAYFGVMMLFVNGASAVQNGVNQSVLPRLARYYDGGVGEFVKLLGRVLCFSWVGMLFLLALVWWRGQWMLSVFAGQEYAEHSLLFLQVMFAGCIVLTGMILGDAIVACRCYKSRVMAVALGLVVNIVVCKGYMGEYGLQAAVWAAILSASVVALTCGLVLIMAVRRRKANYSN